MSVLFENNDQDMWALLLFVLVLLVAAVKYQYEHIINSTEILSHPIIMQFFHFCVNAYNLSVFGKNILQEVRC